MTLVLLSFRPIQVLSVIRPEGYLTSHFLQVLAGGSLYGLLLLIAQIHTGTICRGYTLAILSKSLSLCSSGRS